MPQLAIIAGMRPGEILALTWGSLTGTSAEITRRLYRPLCANMTETPSPPSITVEGGERIQFSAQVAQVESQAFAGQRGGAANSGGVAPVPTPDPEVPEKAKRRQFTAEYKRSIVAQAEACRDDGAIGALLRREGLFVPPHDLAAPEGARRTGCVDAQEARAQIHSQPADGGKSASAERECPSEPSPRTG